jgi:Na+/proline symporter
MLTARATARGALLGWAIGTAATLWISFRTPISFLWWALAGTVVTLVAGYLLSLLDPPPGERQLAGLTWSRRPPPEE